MTLGRMRTARTVLLAIAIVALVASCSQRRSRRQTDNFPPITLQIDNQNFNDVTVYLVWGSDRRRLGVVNGNTRNTFTSRWNGPTFAVEVDVLAGNRYRGEQVSVNPGDEFVIEIPSSLDRFRVYRR